AGVLVHWMVSMGFRRAEPAKHTLPWATCQKPRMIGPMNTSAGKDARSTPKPEPRDAAHVDDLLDAALADTFPASDPVSGLTASAPVRRPAGNESQQ
ncbi:MAG TPA: hypothetical protein VIK49_10320, partial [Steroidobacteraceae bacterium]